MLPALAAALVAGCEPAENVEIEPLPPLTRPTPEQRAGLPEIAGTWRFAGWEVASPEVAAELGEPGRPGDLVLQTQRIDSLAGLFVRGEERIPLVGEVRRDGILSLVAPFDGGAARFAAGRVVRDTLWVELSTLPYGVLSPPTTRWAFVRGPVGQPILRLPSGVLLRDTVVAPPPDTLRPLPDPSLAPPVTPPATPAPPVRETPRPQPQREPAAPPRPEPPRTEPQAPVDTPRDEPPAEAPQEPAADTVDAGPPPPGELRIELPDAP